MKQKGFIQIYTGDGKGKTTAAIGLIARAVAQGLKVCYIYFHKDPERYKYGELNSLKKLGVDIYGFAKKHPHFYKKISPEKVREECLSGIRFVEKIFQGETKRRYDILVLDEILISVRDKFIKEQELVDLLNKKPENIEIILTGRGATEKIIEMADLVSEIRKIKHPYDKGIQQRKGIEY